MRASKNSAEFYELLLKYENEHDTVHGGVSGSSSYTEGLAVINLILFLHVRLEMRIMEMVFQEEVERFGQSKWL